jgi:hypothetical protein
VIEFKYLCKLNSTIHFGYGEEEEEEEEKEEDKGRRQRIFYRRLLQHRPLNDKVLDDRCPVHQRRLLIRCAGCRHTESVADGNCGLGENVLDVE